MNQLRESILMESDMLSSKRRFALFSQPSSIAIGDDSPFRQKLRMQTLIKLRKVQMENQSHFQEICYQVLMYLELEKKVLLVFLVVSTMEINTSILKKYNDHMRNNFILALPFTR